VLQAVVGTPTPSQHHCFPRTSGLQAHIEAEKRRQSEQQQQQQEQNGDQPADPSQQPQAAQHIQREQQARPDHHQQPQQESSNARSGSLYMTGQQAELHLSSFKRLRHTVNARDLYRRTPLIVAAKQGHLECAHLLVDAASNLFAVDREGNT
jgi:ankyrin repeat protein